MNQNREGGLVSADKHRLAVRAAIVAMIAILSTATVEGQGKTDVITLANGDRITGRIVRLERGRLELETDNAGRIEIQWDKITAIEAGGRFVVSSSDGRRFVGSLERQADRRLTIAEHAGATTLEMPEVTGIVLIGASFWTKLDGSVDAGFNYTRASAIAQTTVNSDTVFRRQAFAVRLTASATLTHRSEDDKQDDQGAVALSYARYRGRRQFVSAAAGFESNESLGLVLRSLAAGAVGLRLVNTNRAQFEVAGGLAANQEQGVDTDATRNIEGVLSLKSSYYVYEHPKTNVDASLRYYPSLSAWGRQRVQVNSAIRRELWNDFSVGFNGYYTVDTAPPNPAAARSDLGIALSVGWSY